MIQGMKDGQIWATSLIVDGLSSITTSIITSTSVVGTVGTVTKLGTTNLTATSLVATYNNLISVGSPPAYTQKIETGSWTGTAGGSDWVAFPAAFTAVPNVYITPFKGFITTSMILPGSFMASGTASVAAQWMAVGL